MKKFFKNLMSKPCTCKKCNNKFTQKDIEEYTQNFIYPLKDKKEKSPFCIECLKEMSTQCSNCGGEIHFGDEICLIETSELKTDIEGLNTYYYTINKGKINQERIQCYVLCLSESCNVMTDVTNTSKHCKNYKFPRNIIWFFDEGKMAGKPEVINRSALKN